MLRLLPFSDEQLVNLLGQGGSKEERAIKWLLQKNGQAVKTFVLKNNGSEEQANEVLYTAVTSLIFNIRSGKFNGQSALGTYLYAIAKRQWYKVFAKEREGTKKEEEWHRFEADHVAYEDVSLQADRVDSLQELLSSLHAGCKEVLMLWSQHFNMEEIADQLGYKNAQVAMNKKSKCFKQMLTVVDESPALKSILADLYFT